MSMRTVLSCAKCGCNAFGFVCLSLSFRWLHYILRAFCAGLGADSVGLLLYPLAFIRLASPLDSLLCFTLLLRCVEGVQKLQIRADLPRAGMMRIETVHRQSRS